MRHIHSAIAKRSQRDESRPVSTGLIRESTPRRVGQGAATMVLALMVFAAACSTADESVPTAPATSTTALDSVPTT